jgi:imidazolonepropionase-like amidohydrolase
MTHTLCRSPRILKFGLIASLMVMASAPSGQGSDVVLRAAHWLDVAAGQLRGPVLVQVSGGKIAKIGAPGEFAPSGPVSDLGDATLLPGLIDAHVHLQLGGGLPRDNARAILRAGFTSAVDLGATSDIVLRLRDRIAAGALEGPRILGAGRWVGKRGGICEFGGIGIPGGPEAYRTRVREDIAAGADLTKLCVSTWLADAFSRPDEYEISDAALAATVDEAHRAGRLAVAHAISLGSVRAALRARVDGLAHAAYLDAATTRELRDRGVFMTPTLASLAGDPADPAAKALRAAVVAAHRAGVRLVFGTDGGVLPHGENAKEFAALVDAGIPTIEAIRAATINAAGAYGLGDEFGQIKVGYRADLIAIDGDPLKDVQSLMRPSFVMHDGRVVATLVAAQRHERINARGAARR